jgi:hypothetical protein
VRYILVLLALLLPLPAAAQANAPTPGLIYGRPAPRPLREYTRFTPPANYRALMDSAQACAKVKAKRDFDEIVWLKAPGRNFWVPGIPDSIQKIPSIGVWQVGAGQDTIVIGSEWLTTDWVVKHELVHFVLQRPHPADPVADRRIWGEQCHATWGHLEGGLPSKPGTTTKSPPGQYEFK